jgi:hypothetical protein
MLFALLLLLALSYSASSSSAAQCDMSLSNIVLKSVTNGALNGASLLVDELFATDKSPVLFFVVRRPG